MFQFFLFYKFLENISRFVGSLISCIYMQWIHLRFNYGVIPADLFTVRMVAGAFDPLACVHIFPGIGGTQTWNRVCALTV